VGECIGLDFGTTYSVIARIKDGKAEAVNLGEGGNTTTIDSIVAESPRGKRSYGLLARDNVSQGVYHVYKGFKMLLSEENNDKGMERLKEYGFSSVEEPAEITEYYLRSLIDSYKERCTGGKEIDHLVIGVPEVWFNTSINSRSKLEEIASRIVGPGKVQLESEPKLACAYFVYNYKCQTGKDFSGNILLIDYGGGTLDIAVCSVKSKAGKPDISIIFKTGAGENEQKVIGNAGLAFLGHVVNNALAEAGIADITINNSYYECIHTIERRLFLTTKDIKAYFEDAEGDPEILSDEFWKIRYNDQTVSVTYKMLSDAYYADDISKVFAEKLAEVKAKLEEKGIDYKNEQSDDFKIALVGGFCNFFLTQKQVQETEGLKRGGTYDDHRYLDFDMYLADGSEREKAVAYGAALLANGVVSFENQAPYSLYILPFKKVNGKKVADDTQPFIVFSEYDELEFDKPYMVRKVKTDEHGIVFDSDGKPISIEVKFGTDGIPFIRKTVGKHSFTGSPSEDLLLPGDKVIKMGFSLDRNYILSLHIYDLSSLDNNYRPKETIRRLTNINDLLGGLPYETEEV
jgi:molecular chaperone DnaK